MRGRIWVGVREREEEGKEGEGRGDGEEKRREEKGRKIHHRVTETGRMLRGIRLRG
jgi:hypothetical protein